MSQRRRQLRANNFYLFVPIYNNGNMAAAIYSRETHLEVNAKTSYNKLHNNELVTGYFLPFTKIINVTAGQTMTVNAVLSYITPTPTKSAPGFEGLCACLAVIWCGIALWRRK